MDEKKEAMLQACDQKKEEIAGLLDQMKSSMTAMVEDLEKQVNEMKLKFEEDFSTTFTTTMEKATTDMEGIKDRNVKDLVATADRVRDELDGAYSRHENHLTAFLSGAVDHSKHELDAVVARHGEDMHNAMTSALDNFRSELNTAAATTFGEFQQALTTASAQQRDNFDRQVLSSLAASKAGMTAIRAEQQYRFSNTIINTDKAYNAHIIARDEELRASMKSNIHYFRTELATARKTHIKLFMDTLQQRYFMSQEALRRTMEGQIQLHRRLMEDQGKPSTVRQVDIDDVPIEEDDHTTPEATQEEQKQEKKVGVATKQPISHGWKQRVKYAIGGCLVVGSGILMTGMVLGRSKK